MFFKRGTQLLNVNDNYSPQISTEDFASSRANHYIYKFSGQKTLYFIFGLFP
jgi:hypothetical protein